MSCPTKRVRTTGKKRPCAPEGQRGGALCLTFTNVVDWLLLFFFLVSPRKTEMSPMREALQRAKVTYSGGHKANEAFKKPVLERKNNK